MKRWINRGYRYSIETCKVINPHWTTISYQTGIVYKEKEIYLVYTDDYPSDNEIENMIKTHWRYKKIKELGL